MKRLFVAVPVSEEIKKRVKEIVDKLKETGADLKLVSDFHFTLKFLGDVSEEKIDEIKEKLSSIKQDKFSIKLQKVGVFPSMERINVVWIRGDSKLIPLMREVDEKLNYVRENEFKEDIPHLTIARVKTGRNKDKLQKFIKEMDNLEFGEMIVDEFILYESELTPEGPIYKEIERWKL
jgi:2'-5' RNA ligase